MCSRSLARGIESCNGTRREPFATNGGFCACAVLRCFRGLGGGELTFDSVGGSCGVSFVMPTVLRRIGGDPGEYVSNPQMTGRL